MPYMLNGNLLDVSSEPRLENGTLWVPLRKLATALGGNADWEPSNGIAILYIDNKIATFKAGEASVDLDGVTHELQAAPLNDSGEIWVPVRFFEKVLGYQLDTDLAGGIVDLTKN